MQSGLTHPTNTTPCLQARLYRTPQASAYLRDRHGVSRESSYLAKLRVVGGGPEYVKIGPRDVAYPETALDAWAASLISRPLRSTSKAA